MQDIHIEWEGKRNAKDDSLKTKNENHIANCHKYSLREYLSILYVNLPETLCIVLRKKTVLYHNIATDLKHPEFIMYKPHNGEGQVLTIIGFLKDALDVNVRGFYIYHKNRLILPFLPVVTVSNSRGRGVVGEFGLLIVRVDQMTCSIDSLWLSVGVLDAKFIQPTIASLCLF
ncbi:hypothetical protein L2E82_51940 [Cichorium intybus]|nr:hypothetical protein L2E82_51940 [Cichorium intybus]